jgi:hypothetical protein
MKHAGLAESKRIYVRKACLDLWKSLEGDRNCYVKGAPGTGKSTVVWHWCVFRAHKVRIVMKLPY